MKPTCPALCRGTRAGSGTHTSGLPAELRPQAPPALRGAKAHEEHIGCFFQDVSPAHSSDQLESACSYLSPLKRRQVFFLTPGGLGWGLSLIRTLDSTWLKVTPEAMLSTF